MSDMKEKAQAWLEKCLPEQEMLASLAALLEEVTAEARANMALLDQAATDYRRARDSAEAEVARSHDAILHLTAEVERLTQMMQRIAEDVLPDPVRYADLTPEMVRDAFIAHNLRLTRERDEALARSERPLDVEYTTSCGHTWTMRHTACPTCMADLKANLRALAEAGDALVGTQWCMSDGEAWAEAKRKAGL